MTLDQAVKEIVAATPQKGGAPRPEATHGRQQQPQQQPQQQRPGGFIGWLRS